ncbi:hypothetical protein H6F86_17415 [Phormidium sp. FACHB-592]|uniref:Uncharacterized protein n=1 Tax=Stenomitos frigidus AS-A4 TaxID=2933935 RepID=A0ABV0KPZ9_9CYAN|nr:hypothetical protein [Phormidium sp. FACHB-592]MBD2075640.1 hypothetical protein [Phormidium sp. FACHB-592]
MAADSNRFPLQTAIKKILDDPNSRPEIPGLEPEPEPEPEWSLPRPGILRGSWSESVPVSSFTSLQAGGTISSFTSLQARETEDIHTHRLSGSPAVAVFQDTLYCVYEGPNNAGVLHYCTFDGQNWSSDTPLDNQTSGSPALAVFQDKLYCIHQGYGNDGWLYYFTFDGLTWSGSTKLPKHGTSITERRYPCASLAVHGGSLYCVHEGQGGGKGWLYYTIFDGKTWSEDKPLGDHGTTGGGTLIEMIGSRGVGSRLVCMHEGKNASGYLWYTTFEKRGSGKDAKEVWTSDAEFKLYGKITRHVISGPPALASDFNEFYAVFEEPGNAGYLSSFNNVERVPEWLKYDNGQTTGYIDTSGSPALVKYKDKFYILSQGRRNNGLLQITTQDFDKPTPPGKILLIDANEEKDSATTATYNRRRKALYPYVSTTRFNNSVISLIGSEMTRTNVEVKLRDPDVIFCSASGHGLFDSLYGRMDAEGVYEKVIGKRQFQPPEAKGKIFHFLACHCGYPNIGLGVDLVYNGALAFVGYSKAYQLLLRARRDFLDTDIEIDIALIEGLSVQDAYDRAIARFNETIARYRKKGSAEYDPEAASILEYNRDILVFYGNKYARLYAPWGGG